MIDTPGGWPELRSARIRETADTLHVWSQVVGKVRLAVTPWQNHSWHATFYVSARGLTTSLVSYADRAFELEFDFIEEALVLRTTSGFEARVALRSGGVSGFYAEVIDALAAAGIHAPIDQRPNELAEAIPFPQDHRDRSFDPDAARDVWLAMVRISGVLNRFRTRFVGKSSPVHLFWGSFDLAATRFSGRRAPLHPGGIPNLPDAVTREAYSHEECSAGFWLGGNGVEEPSFYAYAYPSPDGFATARVRPADARFSEELGEFLLPYEAVRAAPDPDGVLLDFLQSTYDAAADLGRWPRSDVDCQEGRLGLPRDVV